MKFLHAIRSLSLALCVLLSPVPLAGAAAHAALVPETLLAAPVNEAVRLAGCATVSSPVVTDTAATAPAHSRARQPVDVAEGTAEVPGAKAASVPVRGLRASKVSSQDSTTTQVMRAQTDPCTATGAQTD